MQNFTFIFDLFGSLHGVFTQKRTIHEELQPMYNDIKDSTFLGMNNDRVNLRSDYNKIKQDFRTSLKEYHTKHGETK